MLREGPREDTLQILLPLSRGCADRERRRSIHSESPSCPFLATALLNEVVQFLFDIAPQPSPPYPFLLEPGRILQETRDTDYRFSEELVESTAQ